MPWPRYLPYIPRSQCWCKQWRYRWFGTPLRILWSHCNDFKDTEIVPLACVDSLPSNCTNYFRQQWLRHWLDAYAPSHCLNQWWFEIIDIHHLCEHKLLWWALKCCSYIKGPKFVLCASHCAVKVSICTCADKHYNHVTCIWIRSLLCLWMP